jgi:secreted PhoX family phosphatase
MDRREFLRTAALGGAGLALASQLTGPVSAATGGPPAPGVSEQPTSGFPYGPLRPPDANGIRLPAGFTSRVVAKSNQRVAGTSYRWHFSPDGGACFGVPDASGDYVYVSNSETLAAAGGGAGAIRFAANGRIRDAYRILRGTNINCAGGRTPWRTWLSAEEWFGGQIWECDPFVPGNGVPRPALGFFAHEAAAVDPVRKQIYLTEDAPDGRLYRFTPNAYPNLSSGRLEVARVHTAVGANRPVDWITVSHGNVGATQPRPNGSTAFKGAEGIWRHGDTICFTTKGDNRVWRLNTRRQLLTVVYDDDLVTGAPLRGVDNVVVSRAGEILVAEDGDNMQVVVLRPGTVVGPVLRIVGQDGSEVTGPAFGPRGDRLYFSSQRARGAHSDGGLGTTYEIRGPFRGRI